MKPRIGVLLTSSWVALTPLAPNWAHAADHLTIDELKALNFPELKLDTVELQKPAQGKSFVQVRGTIGENIQFELLLPEEWNERFVMGGGGGFVGTVQNGARGSVNLGYATIGTDTGHHFEPGYLANWAHDNLEAKVNFGFLAVHRTAVAGKALTQAYYKKRLRYSYFVGCSRGGGQAMMESQRYPSDFDGYVAGAPAFDWTHLAATMVAIAQKLYPDPNNLQNATLTKEALKKLQVAILEQCDAQDGLKDGVIQNPAAVHFDLSAVPGLTDPQRSAIEAIYAGASSPSGTVSVGFPRAMECDPDQWIAWLAGPLPDMVSKDHVPDLTFAFGTQIFKYLVFDDPGWDYSKYDFSTFEKDTHLAASFLNATEPKMEGLKAHKGKLILWHGWADPALSALSTIEYYKQVLANDPQAANWCRLFLIPGCLHCGGGPGASDVDWLSTIVNWVEHDQAPDAIIARHGGTSMTRPLLPYPKVAVYKGSGDTNNASSFGP